MRLPILLANIKLSPAGVHQMRGSVGAYEVQKANKKDGMTSNDVRKDVLS